MLARLLAYKLFVHGAAVSPFLCSSLTWVIASTRYCPFHVYGYID